MNTSMTWLRRAVLGIVLLIGLSSGGVSAQEVSYSINQIDILAQINARGDVLFHEDYHYQVDFFNGARLTIDTGGYDLKNYRVGVLDAKTGEVDWFQEDFTQTPGTFSVQYEGELAIFTVHQPTEQDEVTFRLEYSLANLVTNYQDVAELNRKLVGSGTDQVVDVQAKVYLPAAVEDPDSFRAWAHGAPQGEVYPRTEGGKSYVELTVPRNPAQQFVELRTIFPTSLTPNNPNRVDQPMRDQIIQAENDQVEAERVNYLQHQRKFLAMTLLAVVAGPLLTVGAYYYYYRHRRQLNPAPAMVPEHVYELPEQITPAIMATSYFRGEPNADDFSATMVDLARRGYLKLAEVPRKRRGLLTRKEATTIRFEATEQARDLSDLAKHEHAVMEYLFLEGVEGGRTSTLEAIEEAIESSSHIQKRQNRYWQAFSNFTSATGEARTHASQAYRTRLEAWFMFALIGTLLGGGGAAFLAWVVLDAYIWVRWLLLLTPVSLVALLVLAVVKRRRPLYTHEEDWARRSWLGFRQTLSDVGQFEMREIASLPLWEEYLVYAISLGVGDRVLEAMNRSYGQEELAQLSLPLNFYQQAYIINHIMRDSVANSIQASAPQPSTTSFTGSNSGGFGGGFSGGSSGGSGGGSGASGF